MASTFHGIGTMVCGERDYWPDGSFVTTEWFVVGYVPIFPIISKRISYTRNSDYATWDANGYFVYELLALNRTQVVSVYGWLFAVIAPILVWGVLQDQLVKVIGDEDRAAGLCLCFSAIAFVSPYFFRRWEKRRNLRDWRYRNVGIQGRPID